MNKHRPHEPNPRLGVTAALGAFMFWGLAPIYFKQLLGVNALEIILHRIIWSIPLLVIFLLIRDGSRFFTRLRLPRKTILGLLLSGSLVAANWLTFVWAVTHDHILETSLGYFINPLVNVLLGVVFLRERLTRIQVLAVSLAAVGTAYLGWFLGQPPWISLFLAASFGCYGLARKKLGVGPMLGLLWETSLLAIPAGLTMVWMGKEIGLTFSNVSPGTDLFLIGTGLITVIPLIWFNTAAQNLTLTAVGFFQYIAPSITFLLAVFFYGEAFTQGHMVAFTCIWLSLAMVSGETLVRTRKARLAR